MQEWCEEFPSNHEPKKGSYGSSPISFGFSAYGFGFGISPPAYNVDFHQWVESGKTVSRWDMDSWFIEGVLCQGFIFKDYINFALAFRVPEGRKPFVYVGAEVQWWQVTERGTFAYYSTESIWTSVDPPGAGAFPQLDPEPLQNYPEVEPVLPCVIFNVSPATPWIGQLVTFDASSSFDPDGGGITDYYWDFGDGVYHHHTTNQDWHRYTYGGLYNVTLTITDDDGFNNTKSKLVHVLQSPEADFTWDPEWPFIGQVVTFDASASYDPDGYIVEYQWDWGDGSPVEVKAQPIAYHAFQAGWYEVTLTVTDEDGRYDYVKKMVCP